MTYSNPPFFLHNSFTRQKEAFTPLDAQNIRVYTCGPTVYDAVHLGNLRAMLTADVLVRLLRSIFPHVTFVRNITDVDDKITQRARENGETLEQLTSRTTQAFHRDIAALNILPPDIEPRATHHISDMLTMIARLIENNHAYVAQGHVLFRVASFASYGALSGRSPDDLLAGARVEVAPYKDDPGDFVLWKPSTPEQPGWESPYGRGRPGWHIECSAMAQRYLGESFDIHTGGNDLIFPHHENERAQTLCCYPDATFARHWVHNAMLLSDGEKMSKSAGNFFTVRQALDRAPAEALRLLFLGTHYRSSIDFTWEKLEEAKRTLDRFYRAMENLSSGDEVDAPRSVKEALGDDLNTPLALTIIHALAAEALKGNGNAARELRASGRLLGIFSQTSQEWFGTASPLPKIDAMIKKRQEAKNRRDFATADQIRDALRQEGIVIEDTPHGTKWRRA